MKKSKLTVLLSFMLFGSWAFAQQTKTASFKVQGNCGMCEETIEKAGKLAGVTAIKWNEERQEATLTYQDQQVSKDDILKSIALAGYDNEAYRAPDASYEALHACCQYTREPLEEVPTAASTAEVAPLEAAHEHHQMAEAAKPALQAVFAKYFNVKDALVRTDAAAAKQEAQQLVKEINAVDMSTLGSKEHDVWMKVLKNVKATSTEIAASTQIDKQRKAFVSLSEDFAALAKVSKNASTVYILHCPMANDNKGANWLSLESAVKNPFYGAKMMSCGSLKETIK